MKGFFKQVLAVIVGTGIMGLLLFFFFFAIVAASMSMGEKTSITKIEKNSVLKIDLSKLISERNKGKDYDFNYGKIIINENLGLQNIVNAIEHAKTDDKIEGIYLPLSTMPNGFATADVLRRALIDFKTSGKFIVAYGEYASQKAYYVASVANKIYINPEGIVELRGIGVQLSFYKKFLDKIDAEVEVFKVGTFKSAIEPFIREDISEPNREQLEFLLGGIKEDFINNISKSRGISTNALENIINNLEINSSEKAVELKIIDGAYYADQVSSDLYERLGIDEDTDEEIEFIDINKYGKSIKKDPVLTKNKIAVVYAEGEIVSAEEDDKLSSEEFAKIISDLRKNENVKAIVLRVNSPGGSALASEVIWRELELAKKDKKVVVSMGNVAASGGYYIACGADYIFAEENTITGSIGVFGLIPNFEKFLEERIGVTFDEVNLNEHATMNGVTKKLDQVEHDLIQNSVERIYETFTNRVAEGRNMNQDSVKVYAEGRVWTGEQALKIGFVDEIGDLSKAIEYAVELSELEEYNIVEYPKKKDPMQKILEEFGIENVKEKIIKSELSENYVYYKKIKDIQTNFNTIQMRMPFDLTIK